MQAAQQRVLDMPELFEQILSHVPIKDLFILRRVNSFWRNGIAASPQLQTLMFLRPLPHPSGPHRYKSRIFPRPSSSSNNKFESKSERPSPSTAPKTASKGQATIVLLNPLLVRKPEADPDHSSHSILPADSESRRTMQMTRVIFLNKVTLRDSPYLTNPPCRKVCCHVTLKLEPTSVDMHLSLKVENTQGVRFSDIVLAVRPHIEVWHAWNTGMKTFPLGSSSKDSIWRPTGVGETWVSQSGGTLVPEWVICAKSWMDIEDEKLCVSNNAA